MSIARVVIVCNALDDITRARRGITTDSPAASRKVVLLCRALRLAGVRPCILSLGRGRADGSTKAYPVSVQRIDGIPIVYAAFSHLPLWSQLVSLVSPAILIRRLRRPAPVVVIYYNRLPAYIPALLVAAASGFRNILDLEDGEVPVPGRSSWKGMPGRATATLFDRLCSAGALLACSALENMTRVRPVHCYYGTAERGASQARWTSPTLTVLMSGTLAPETGADVLIEAIRRLRRESPAWAQQLRFEVTGMGPSLDALSALDAPSMAPAVIVHGRTTHAQYKDILGRSDVGLALKPVGGAYADTTFPSKVIEFAGAGLLVLSTDISDVRRLLGDGAVYLNSNDAGALIALLKGIVEGAAASRLRAEVGQRAVLDRCAPRLAGAALENFLFKPTV